MTHFADFRESDASCTVRMRIGMAEIPKHLWYFLYIYVGQTAWSYTVICQPSTHGVVVDYILRFPHIHLLISRLQQRNNKLVKTIEQDTNQSGLLRCVRDRVNERRQKRKTRKNRLAVNKAQTFLRKLPRRGGCRCLQTQNRSPTSSSYNYYVRRYLRLHRVELLSVSPRNRCYAPLGPSSAFDKKKTVGGLLCRRHTGLPGG
jgi:hypothetical protein